MARPKKLSGNDKFMLSKLRGDGLIIKPAEPGYPIKMNWFEWRGIKLFGESCNINKNYRLPKTKLGFGNTNRETDRRIASNNDKRQRLTRYIAICKRLLEYKEKNILTDMLSGHPMRRQCYRILKKYSYIANNCQVNEKYDVFLDKTWGLPKP